MAKKSITEQQNALQIITRQHDENDHNNVERIRKEAAIT